MYQHASNAAESTTRRRSPTPRALTTKRQPRRPTRQKARSPISSLTRPGLFHTPVPPTPRDATHQRSRRALLLGSSSQPTQQEAGTRKRRHVPVSPARRACDAMRASLPRAPDEAGKMKMTRGVEPRRGLLLHCARVRVVVALSPPVVVSGDFAGIFVEAPENGCAWESKPVKGYVATIPLVFTGSSLSKPRLIWRVTFPKPGDSYT